MEIVLIPPDVKNSDMRILLKSQCEVKNEGVCLFGRGRSLFLAFLGCSVLFLVCSLCQKLWRKRAGHEGDEKAGVFFPLITTSSVAFLVWIVSHTIV
jgi:hypothetical protein